MRLNLVLIAFCFQFLTLHLEAQEQYTLSGVVADAESGETMIGVAIKVSDLPTIGTVSNAYGYYSLTLPQGRYKIQFTYIGYQTLTHELVINKDVRFDANIRFETQNLEEVIVKAEKKNENVTSSEIGIERLEIKDVKKIPVLLGEQDIIRTLTLTPGIKTTGEGSGGMSVRGGNNSQNLVLLDEAVVFNSNHLFGFFSTFNSDAVKDIAMYKGTAPSLYGGRISSVLDVKMNEGNLSDYHYGGSLGLISARAFVEGPIVKDKSSFLVTARRTYADMYLRLSSDESLKNNQLYFYDLNMKANYKIDDDNRIYLSGYFGRDVFDFSNSFGLDWGNVTGTLRWNHIWNSKLFSNTSLIYSNYDYKVSIFEEEDDSFSLLSVIENIDIKQDFQYFINKSNTLSFGAYARYNEITPGQLEVSEESNLNPLDLQNKHSIEAGIFISNQMKATDKLNLEYGIRFNSFHLLGSGDFYSFSDGIVTDTSTFGSGEVAQSYYNLEPRINVSYLFDEMNSMKFSYTRNTQNIHLIQNSNAAAPTDIWISSSNNVKPEIGDQVSMGYFRNFNDNKLHFSAEVYYKWMSNQFDLRDGAEIGANELIEGELLFGKGRAYGLEIMLKKKYGRLTGWTSYTLSRTERTIDGINEGNWYSTRQDATHDISIVGMYELNASWSLSATWVYTTGNAVTFPSGKYEVDGTTQLYYTERNGYRMPAYHRLDLGATWTIKKSKKFESNLNFSLYNAYGRKNAWVIDFQEDPNDPSRTKAEKTYLFTYVPSISYSFKF